MTDKPTHTPLPWERQTLETEYDPGVYIVGSNLGGLVGAALPWPTEIESGDYSRVEANAALIVQAVNSHHRLIEALERFIADYDDDDRADAGIHPLMEAHIADFRAALREVGR